MMDEAEFWRLIDQTRETAGDDTDHQAAALRALFRDRPREDLEALARRCDDIPHPGDPAGADWDDDDLPARFPRLHARTSAR